MIRFRLTLLIHEIELAADAAEEVAHLDIPFEHVMMDFITLASAYEEVHRILNPLFTQDEVIALIDALELLGEMTKTEAQNSYDELEAQDAVKYQSVQKEALRKVRELLGE